MSVERLLTQRGTLERATQVKDAGGRFKTNWTVVGIAGKVPCLVMVLYLRSGQITTEEASKRTLNNLQVFFTATQDVQSQDRLTIGTQAYVVRMVTPAINARTGVVSHLEGILELEDQLGSA